MANFISSPIDKYEVVLYGKDATDGDLAAYIHCFHNEKIVASCSFCRDGSTLPENRNQGGRVWLIYPWSHFGAMVDVLRNEKPLHFGFIESTKLGYVSTQSEPVGEGDGR